MDLPTYNHADELAELQGLYGPFRFPEILLQKIWARRDFALTRAQLRDGRKLEILFPGRWNRLEGPDFHDARLLIDGVEVTGDVELHLHEREWRNHRHQKDPAFDRVVLHVVLFVPDCKWTSGAKGQDIPILALLPLLHQGLEEHANEDAIERITHRASPDGGIGLQTMEQSQLKELLLRKAVQRFDRKTYYAGKRIRKLGWKDACHHTALEILGYRRNRAPMLGIASEYPLDRWIKGGVSTAAVFEKYRDYWELRGLRPLNHPLKRLRQYAEWLAVSGDWPGLLQDMCARLPGDDSADGSDTRKFRKSHNLPDIRKQFETICGNALSGTRLDNMVCDGFLPLLTAMSGKHFGSLWFHWFAGDIPGSFRKLFRNLPGDREMMFSHGVAQGILAYMMEHEA